MKFRVTKGFGFRVYGLGRAVYEERQDVRVRKKAGLGMRTWLFFAALQAFEVATGLLYLGLGYRVLSF